MTSLGLTSRYDAYLLDVDGVLIRGDVPIEGATEAFRRLRDRAPTLLLTNNSSRSRAQVAQRLDALGFPLSSDDVLPSSYLAAAFLSAESGSSSFWPLGEAGLIDELEAAGHRHAARPVDAEWVVVGIHRRVTYKSLSDALQALRAGARLIATNTDATLPVPGGVLPGAGALVGAIEGMGFKPEAVVGKPNAFAYETAIARFGLSANRILMIGDRMETDIAGGDAAGLDTALLLSGVTETQPPPGPLGPTWIAADLRALVNGNAQAGHDA